MFLLAALSEIEEPKERDAVKALFDRYSKHIKRYVTNSFPALREEADDVVQQVFLDVIRYRKHFLNSDEELCKSLLYIYARNKSLNLKRERNNEADYLNGAFYAELSNSERLSDVVFSEVSGGEEGRVRAIIESLPPTVQDMVIMKYVHGFKNCEIAEQLGYTESNVGTLLNRALKKIKEEMEAEAYENV